jgi:hypothetical protein
MKWPIKQTLTYWWLFIFSFAISFALWSFSQTPLLLFSLDGNTEGHLIYHLHKEYQAQWACSAVSLPVQKPMKMFVIFVLYFFTLWSRHGNTHGPIHQITNFSHCSHVFWCAIPSAPSGSRKSCLHAFELGTVAWHICICCKWPHVSYTVWCVHYRFTHSEGVPMFLHAELLYAQGTLHGILGDDWQIC